jgi:hypothetical protein
MRFLLSITISAVSMADFMAQSAVAQPMCDTNYIGLNDGDWETLGNWDFGAPDNTKVACIPSDKMVDINSAAEAKAIWIKRSGATQGTLEVYYSRSLKLYEDSQIDGILELEGQTVLPAELLIAPDAQHNNALTITGNGGSIVGLVGFGGFPVLRGSTGNEQLTITGGSMRDTSLVVHGRLELKVNLINNAYVVADHGDLKLTTNAKSGTGTWAAERDYTGGTSHGRLVVDAEVTGGGTWTLGDHASAKIEFNVDCTQLTGNFSVQRGTLQIDADLTTSGSLDIQSLSGYVPKITVAQGMVATFD